MEWGAIEGRPRRTRAGTDAAPVVLRRAREEPHEDPENALMPVPTYCACRPLQLAWIPTLGKRLNTMMV
jgi:hypothetical protein